MKKERSKYPLELRQDAVNHLITIGKSIRKVAADLGIADHNLRYWKNDFMKKHPKKIPARKILRKECVDSRKKISV